MVERFASKSEYLPSKNNKRFNTYMPQELWDFLKSEAEKKGKSNSQILRELILAKQKESFKPKREAELHA